MYLKNFHRLIDPYTKCSLKLKKNKLISNNGRVYQIINKIPRFVYSENYAKDFGFQWKKFSKTQLDSYTGLKISENRLLKIFNQSKQYLKKKKILEAGSGAGRFTEIFLKNGAIVDSFDYSNAVEANLQNNQNNNLILVQADIRFIPFPQKYYDYVFCLGVLQHTPNTEESINNLWKMLKLGGKLYIDHYLFKWRTVLPPPFGQALNLYRFFILLLPQKKRYEVVRRLVNFWFPVHWKFRKNILMQKVLRRISPVIFHYGQIKLKNKKMYYEWSLLDTHDSTTDKFKNLITKKKLLNIFTKLKAKNIKISYGGNGIELSCEK